MAQDPKERFYRTEVGTTTSARTPNTIGPNKASNSPTYAGNEASASNANFGPDAFQGVYSEWNVPAASPTPVATQVYAWVGLYPGSQNPEPQILQDGTSSAYSGGKASYFAWTERCCTDDGHAVTLPFAVGAGDLVYAQTELAGVNQVNFFVEDVTTQHYKSVPEAYKGPNFTTGFAEVIVERPTSALADFGQVQFQEAEAERGNSWACVGSYYHLDPHMVSSGGQPLAVPSAFTDNGAGCAFPVTRENPSIYS